MVMLLVVAEDCESAMICVIVAFADSGRFPNQNKVKKSEKVFLIMNESILKWKINHLKNCHVNKFKSLSVAITCNLRVSDHKIWK